MNNESDKNNKNNKHIQRSNNCFITWNYIKNMFKCNYYSYCCCCCHSSRNNLSFDISKISFDSKKNFKYNKKQNSKVYICYNSLMLDSQILMNFSLLHKNDNNRDIKYQSDLNKQFFLQFYNELQKDELIILENYPFFLITLIKDINLTIYEKKEKEKLIKIELLNENTKLECIINFIKYKMINCFKNPLHFVIILHSKRIGLEKSIFISDLITDFVIHIDQSFLFDIIAEKLKLKTISEKKSEYDLNKGSNYNIIKGKLGTRYFKAKPELIIINNFEPYNIENHVIIKEILKKSIVDTLSFTQNFILILHNTFPITILPEIIDKSFNELIKEPINFSMEIELIYINNKFESILVFFGNMSEITLKMTNEYIIENLFPTQNIEISQKNQKLFEVTTTESQKILLSQKILQIGSRKFQKIVFGLKNLKNSEKNMMTNENLLYKVVEYLYNHNKLTINEVKFFPFYQKILSLNAQFPRHLSIDSKIKEKNTDPSLISELNKSSELSINELKENKRKYKKRNKTLKSNPRSVEDFIKINDSRILHKINKDSSFTKFSNCKSKNILKIDSEGSIKEITQYGLEDVSNELYLSSYSDCSYYDFNNVLTPKNSDNEYDKINSSNGYNQSHSKNKKDNIYKNSWALSCSYDIHSDGK